MKGNKAYESSFFVLFELWSTIRRSVIPVRSVQKYIRKLKVNIRNLKAIGKKILGDLKDIYLFIVKFHMCERIAENERKCRLLFYLDGSVYKCFDFVIKTFRRIGSVKKISTQRDCGKRQTL